MTLRRIILVLLALLATFAVAVQRDTFIRRWCLSAPPPASRPAGILGRLIEEFPLDGMSSEQAVLQVERVTGARIHPLDQIKELDSFGPPPWKGTVRCATVEQLLWRILFRNGCSSVVAEVAAEAPGIIVIGNQQPSVPASVRVHNVASLLAKDAVADPSTGSWAVLQTSDGLNTITGEPIEQAQAMIEKLTELRFVWIPTGGGYQGGSAPRWDPVLRFGN